MTIGDSVPVKVFYFIGMSMLWLHVVLCELSDSKIMIVER